MIPYEVKTFMTDEELQDFLNNNKDLYPLYITFVQTLTEAAWRVVLKRIES